MDICIRLENKEDHRIVEEMTREAFWNLHIPGCDEHLLAHKLRDCAAFIPKLNFVALSNGHVVGNIMYCHAAVKRDDGAEVSVLTFDLRARSSARNDSLNPTAACLLAE